MKLYLGIMAVSCFNCEYMLNILEEQFVLNGGNLEWITGGLKKVDPRLTKFAEINEILAFKPWQLQSKHIQNLLKKDDNGLSWNFQQVLMGCIVLIHYHSMCCFVQGQGLNEDSEHLSEQLVAERASSRDFKDMEESSDADNQTIKFLQGQSAQSSNEEEEEDSENFFSSDLDIKQSMI